MSLHVVFLVAFLATLSEGAAIRVGLGGTRGAVSLSLATKVEPRHAEIAGASLDRRVENAAALDLRR